jgi:glycine/D-amino acid oxidase-like deaminating enzyme
MQTSTLIIGQGLCGTWLSYWLQQQGASFLVLDENRGNSSTKVASGIINPVTGRRMAKTWLADELLPFAEHAYAALGKELEATLITPCDILDFFSAPDRRLDFEKRAQQFESYLNWPTDEHAWLHFFNYSFGYGIVSPAWQADVQTMLQGWRARLLQTDSLLEEKYEPEALQILPDGIRYKNITAERMVFCDGTAAMEHHFFTSLPFAFNKGEALIISAPELPHEFIYKKTSTITPWKDGLFWVGSNYDREYTDDQPSTAFRQQTEQWLKHFLKIPFTVEEHLAALRPTTLERRPFVGFHPNHHQLGIFNGMGTKGVSLAPFFGKQLAENIVQKQPIMAEVDVKRHARILART